MVTSDDALKMWAMTTIDGTVAVAPDTRRTLRRSSGNARVANLRGRNGRANGKKGWRT